jgi:hypothetical protein
MRETVTTWLEISGLLLLAAGAAVEVATFTVAGGLATGGALLIGASALLAWRARPRPDTETSA